MKSNGRAETTLTGIGKRLRFLEKHCNIAEPEEVKRFISNIEGSSGYKDGLALAYLHYCRFVGLSFQIPRFVKQEKEIQLPTEENLDLLIASASKPMALKLKILKECGLRPIELLRLRVRDCDLEKGLIAVRSAKGGIPRTVRISSNTLDMLRIHVSKLKLEDNVFNSNSTTNRCLFDRLKKRVVKKFQKPEILKIRMYDFRHLYGSRTYRKTKDILHVKHQLGHRKLETTLKYVHLTGTLNETEFHCKTATNIQEATELIAEGFDYVTTFENRMLFRKPKL